MLPEDSFYVPHDNREAASSKLKYIAWNSRKGDRARWSLVRDSGSVFIRISAQPRISAHLEWAPILKTEKVNKRSSTHSSHRRMLSDAIPKIIFPGYSCHCLCHPSLKFPCLISVIFFVLFHPKFTEAKFFIWLFSSLSMILFCQMT